MRLQPWRATKFWCKPLDWDWTSNKNTNNRQSDLEKKMSGLSVKVSSIYPVMFLACFFFLFFFFFFEQMGFIFGMQECFNLGKSIWIAHTLTNKGEKTCSSQLIEKRVEKIKHIFMIKSPDKLHLREIIMTWYCHTCKTHSQHHSHWWNMENLSFDFRKHVRILSFTTSKQ